MSPRFGAHFLTKELGPPEAIILFSIVCLVVLVILVKFGGRGPAIQGPVTEVGGVILRLKICLPSDQLLQSFAT